MWAVETPRVSADAGAAVVAVPLEEGAAVVGKEKSPGC